MRILVCGGRNFAYKPDPTLLPEVVYYIRDNEKTNEAIDFVKSYSPTVIIQGGAKGGDEIGKLTAEALGIKNEEYRADWKGHGRAAGPIRNQQMLDEGQPHLVIAFKGYKGTADMVSRAKKAGVEVIEVE